MAADITHGRHRPAAGQYRLADLPTLATLDVRVFGADQWPLLTLLLGVTERALVAEHRRRLARPVGEAGAGGQGLRVLGAEDALADGQQVGVLVAGRRRAARLAGPAGEVTASGKRLRVLGAEDPLADGQQPGVLVAGQRRVARLAGPSGEAKASGKGRRVLGAEDPLADG
jgi:hypothetical protein